MPESLFHFARPEWLFALLGLIPVLGWLIYSVVRPAKGPLHRYADEHLLPHLTGVRELSVDERWSRFTRWGLLWILLVLALAGPRWDYTDIEAFSPASDLVILMDISRSMNVADVPPSRLARARQEVQDLVALNREVRIGMIAFATVPHVVAPITEDTQSILNALPAVSSDLANLQGSRLIAALERTQQLLGSEGTKSSSSILLISDGDFDEPGLLERIEDLAEQGIVLHTMGIGTTGGGPVPARVGQSELMRERSGKIIESRLNEPLLQQLAQAGGGYYQHADFRDQDSRNILKLAIGDVGRPTPTEEKTRVWNERFYWLIFPLLLFLLSRFRVRRPGETRV
ncbi:MAG: VWA domain-containing protein [Candidatus Thiodiazotropha sp. (ex Lucina aurantia)]|uniref:von Willebrand factor type A domain protein n=1 Tax=Candidatus Thiodiazotropha endolucinida TaxID=1655433 RepID=A0A7Z0VQF9_9GAMM|nr:VWA domain-containing protein [Candidatus Thiodiazotropha endolucinida]MBT3013832.1 VWA domain-containing protein [Candidatus Thiodiazotropha sp. (ex Lucina pensylvanica)]MBT3018002.1 VWA domain-containing protein [Candidatus Thiodiazotropha taylori]MBT3044035.1 VWA domain-containing protein [Candidatus Thiodiazotropha sp. (ex Codakia orbicularis)]MBV2105275.1 VWA domain-containing protein [Candidatus Thiodiazotropha sp. (ex Lucina aurantia)]MBT3025437.1 VWA domain-containing protein [Candi